MNALPLALLGRRAAKGLTIAGLAALAALATLAWGGALLAGGAAARIDAQARGVTIAVADADAHRQAARAAALAALLARRDDLVGVVPADPRVAALSFEGAAPDAEAPGGGRAPALIDATLRPGCDTRALGRALAGQPGVAVVRGGARLGPLAALLGRLQAIAVALGLAALVATMPLAGFAVRAMLAAGGGELAVLRRLGASDRQIGALVGGRIVREALLGSLAGLAIGGAALLAIAIRLLPADDGGVSARADPWGWTMLVAIPPITVALAGAAARATVRLGGGRR